MTRNDESNAATPQYPMMELRRIAGLTLAAVFFIASSAVVAAALGHFGLSAALFGGSILAGLYGLYKKEMLNKRLENVE